MIDAWLLRLVAQRARRDARLLLVVAAVAIVSTTLIASLALLVAVTEESGLRAALGGASSERSEIDVTVVDPSASVPEVLDAVTAAVRTATTDAVGVEPSTLAESGLESVDGVGDDTPVLAYLAESAGLADSATLVDGRWPGPADDGVAVAVPEPAAAAVGIGVGDAFTLPGAAAGAGTAVRIAGVYRIDDAEDAVWSGDRLGGAGIDRGFALPGSRTFVAADAIGPLITAPGALERAGVRVARVDIRYAPDFSRVSPAALSELAEGLGDAATRVPARAGAVGERVRYSSDVAELLGDAAAGLAVTRSTVITAGALLALVALVALAQSARLLTASRTEERRLLHARGGSGTALRGMAVLESLAIGAAAAVAGPLLAALVYRGVAAHPSVAAAGLPAALAPPAPVWAAAAGAGLLFAAVLTAPLLRAPDATDDVSAVRSHRRGTTSGVLRIVLDLLLLGAVVVLHQQLVAYRPPVGASSGVDAVLVITPALLVGAGAVLAVRLVPVLARTLQTAGARSRGAVVPLASWEVGRRAPAATAVVLLLTLAVAVASFGSTFLASWRQSQTDQAALAIGAPVRVPADVGSGAAQAVALRDGAAGDPSPVLRRAGRVAGPSQIESYAAPSGPAALVLGLDAGGRALLDRGRVGEEGGAVVAALPSDVAPTDPVPLPEDTAGLGVTVAVGEVGAPFDGVEARISGIVEDESGLLTAVALGAVPVDGLEYTLSNELPEAIDGSPGAARATGLVGVVASFAVDDSRTFRPRPDVTAAGVLLRDAAVFDSIGAVAALPLDRAAEWVPRTSAAGDRPPFFGTVPDGWELSLRVAIPGDLDGRPVSYSIVGWPEPGLVPVVATAPLIRLMSLREGSALVVVVGNVQVPARLAGVVDTVPGAAPVPGGLEVADDDRGAQQAGAVVVDLAVLSRALAVAGSPQTAADEWWVDVPAGGGRDYIDAHAGLSAGRAAQSAEVEGVALAEGPLRIGTPIALLLVIAGAALLAAVGFAVHAAAALRARRMEFAQLRALGLTRRSLVAVVGAETVLLGALGALLGALLGVLLGAVVAPLVGLAPDGGTPEPPVEVVVPIEAIGAVAAVVAVTVAAVVLTVAARQRSADPAAVLRESGG